MVLPQQVHQARVEPAPALAELRAVGHLLGQRMPEGVLGLGIDRLLVDELGLDQSAQDRLELLLRGFREPRQQTQGEAPSDDRRGLEHRLLALAQAIDARRQHGLHSARNLQYLHRLGQPVAAAVSRERTGVDQRLHHLLDEEGVARRALENPFGQARE